ncbi:SulP family inorganic anion transporter [Neptunicoccus sediminis]|uniref:SulP family inorganic anion transporter n=1 Tax=Neptunicoccus sediminis TaxID=1892596 RepID=UPI000845F3E5|nr:SulP family inorganic anion transporter [Neptunicoccus sediminis]
MRYSEYFPPLEWYTRVNKNTVAADAYAGLINAALVLPQGVAFATIAGLPPQYGLFTAIITAIVAALFGSSMIMISGPTTAISAVLFTTLSDFAAPGTMQYIEMALTLTILVGLFQIAGGFARLGGLVSFVSHSVMTAFTMAAALLIAVSQLAGVTGIVVERGGNIAERLMRLAEHWGDVNLYALLIAGTTLALAVLMQKFTPKLPGFLIALLAGSALAYGIDAVNHGVEMVGALPSMMPQLAPPTPSVRDVVQLAPGAAAIALVGALEAISIGRAFAVRRRETFDTSQEMIGQGLSNVVGGFFQCYAGSGSFTRSGVNATAGAVTPLSGIFASGFLLLILIFIAPWVAYIPKPAMAGLILLVAYRLIEFSELRHIITSSRPETVILVLTLAAGLFIELDFAIYVGVIASLCVFIYESSHPELPVTAPVLQPDGTRKFRNVEHQGVTECPQLMIFRLDGPLYFGSVENVAKAYKKNCARDPRQIHKILYMKGVGKTDLAGADFLIQAIRDAKAEGGSFRIVALFPPLVDSLYRFHVIDELGEENLHSNKSDAVSAAMNDLSRNICEGCLRDVFWECDNVMRRDD